MELSCPKKELNKTFQNFLPSKKLNKTPLGTTGCLSNLYYLLAAQASSFPLFPEISQLGQTWYPTPHCAALK